MDRYKIARGSQIPLSTIIKEWRSNLLKNYKLDKKFKKYYEIYMDYGFFDISWHKYPTDSKAIQKL